MSNKHFRILGCFSLLIFMHFKGQSQQDTCRINLISSVKKDSIILRWGINTPQTWNTIRNSGFWLERTIIPKDTTEAVPKFERLSKDPIKPLNQEQWKARFKDQSKTAAMAQALLYSEIGGGINSGVSPELIIQQDRDQSMRLGFTLLIADQDFEVAKALGLGFSDKTLQADTKYLYRVYTANKVEEMYVDTAYIFVNSSEPDILPVMRIPLIEIGDQKITLKWRSNEKTGFTAYHIERAKGNSNRFERINDAPYIKLNSNGSDNEWIIYTDSVPNYTPFTYRIIGITPFGELSEPSQAITIQARDLTPPLVPFITKVKETQNQQMEIEWILPDSSADLSCFKVVKSNSNEGVYEVISEEIDKTKRIFIDKSKTSFKGAYYKIQAYDTAGNYALSLPFYGMLTDSFPPAIPPSLQGYIDTNSVVHLKWHQGEEPDLMGYRVYFANSPDHEFSVLTSHVIADTVYNDTIQKRTLTKHIYYSIAAVDFNYNHSKMSPWVKIRRLDVIPPDAPIFKNVEVQDSSVHLTWHNSSSDDVAEHVLLRKIAGEKEYVKLASWIGYPNKCEYIDKQVAPKTFYEYAMVAIDSSNLKSNLSPKLSVRTFDRGIRVPVETINVTYDPSKKRNILEWDYNAKGEYSFLLYRSYQNFGLTKLARIEGNKNEFSDSDLIGKGEYTYAIKVIYKDGGESPLSTRKSIIIE